MNTILKLNMCFAICMGISSCSNINQESNNSTSQISTNENIDYEELKIFFTPSSYNKNQISKNIYGTFIEHIEKCIYNGLWAEEILDRKFVSKVGEDVSQWKVTDSENIESDNVNTYSGTYAIRFKNKGAISQKGLKLKADKYNGYFYGKGNGKIKISLKNSNELIEKEIAINSSEYKKYEYDVDINTQGKYTITFEALSGIFSIDSLSLMKSDNINGMRYDTLQLLKQLNAPFYRWPGGNFVSGYDFYDGILDRDKRVSKRNLNYAGKVEDFKDDNDRLMSDLTKIEANGFYSIYEPNDFGIDEFMYMCNYLNTTPNVVLNSGLGSVQMAIDEVEYLNGTSGTYASMRPQKEPYNVEYISIGNEMNGTWQLGHMDIASYTKKHNEIAEGIKKISNNLKIIGVGDNYSSWSQTMVNQCNSNIDLLSEHFYATRNEYDVEEHIKSLKGQAEMRIKLHRNLQNAANIKMAIDEYAYENAESQSRLKDGMGVASCLNVFMKNADVVDVACYSSTINAVQGQIYTDDYNVFLEGSGYATMLYSKYMEDYYLNINCNTKSFDSYIEVSGSIASNQKEMSISIINTSTKRLKITNNSISEYISRSYVTSESFENTNKTGSENLELIENDTSSNACYVEPYSITILQVKLR